MAEVGRPRLNPPRSPRARVIGERVQQYRERAGYSQQDLGEMVGVDTKTISNIEGGRTDVRLELLERIGAVLGFSVPDLYVVKEAS